MSQKWLVLIALLILIAMLLLTSNHKQTENPVPSTTQNQLKTGKQTGNPQSSDAWLIEPGVRVGSITAQSTLSDLQKTFGAANVEETQVGVDTIPYPGACIYPNSPEKSLCVVWTPNKKGIERVSIQGEKTLWHTQEGITLGSSLKTLETLNQGPFTLNGFGCDEICGLVVSWGDQGKLKERLQHGFMLGLTPKEDKPEKIREAVRGDREFSSQDPNMQALNPVVDGIIIVF